MGGPTVAEVPFEGRGLLWSSVHDPTEVKTTVALCNMKLVYSKDYVRAKLKVHADAEPLAAIIEHVLLKAGGAQKQPIRVQGWGVLRFGVGGFRVWRACDTVFGGFGSRMINQILWLRSGHM